MVHTHTQTLTLTHTYTSSSSSSSEQISWTVTKWAKHKRVSERANAGKKKIPFHRAKGNVIHPFLGIYNSIATRSKWLRTGSTDRVLWVLDTAVRWQSWSVSFLVGTQTHSKIKHGDFCFFFVFFASFMSENAPLWRRWHWGPFRAKVHVTYEQQFTCGGKEVV